jgi:PhnB protein
MPLSSPHKPDGFHTITPHVVVGDPVAAIDFYRRAIGATEILRHTDDQGRVTHAEILVGDSPVMLTGPFAFGPLVAHDPVALGGTSSHFYLYVPDADALFAQAVAAGAREVMPVSDRPYGDRCGGVIDPFGHMWWLATFTLAVAGESLQTRLSRAR